MYLKRNIETCSRNHCCRGKALSVTYSVCVSVVLGIRHAKQMRRIINFSPDDGWWGDSMLDCVNK